MQNVFFCFGPPKSGTTFLQRLLDSHPAVCCPPEQNLQVVYRELNRLVATYNIGLRTVAARTGGQQPLALSNQFVDDWMREFPRLLAKSANCGERQFGVSDNSLLGHLPLFGRLFPDSKYLAIFRHPLTRALSAWQHNRTLANLEGSEEHLRPLRAAGSFENWCILIAEDFVVSVRNFRQACSNGMIRGHFVLYENLRRQDTRELAKALDFLEVTADVPLVRSLYQENEFERQRQAAPRPHFFRAGTISLDEVPVDTQVRQRVLEICQAELQFLGYDEATANATSSGSWTGHGSKEP